MISGNTFMFVLGGVRSGKSVYAEYIIDSMGGTPIYVATAAAGDSEMATRIHKHQARRGRHWRTIEAPLELANVIRGKSASGSPLLVDCLTLWLTNIMLAQRPLESAVHELLAAFGQRAGPIVVVSNEVGQGIVPDNALARRFCDEAGRLHQAVAALADRVVFMTAGLPCVLKPAT